MLPGGKVLGGAPANFAYHCSQMGTESHVISAIGKDDPGCEILEQVEMLGIPSDFLFIEEQFPTSTVTVKLDARGHPEYTIHENVAWDHIPADQKALDMVKGADAVCFGSLAQRSPISRKSIQSYLAALSADCLRVFDVNLRQHFYSKEVIEESLGFADVLKLNDDELVILSDLFSLEGDDDELIGSLQQSFGLKLIALTRGGDGSTLYTGNDRSEYRVDAVRAVDTVGAGDSFTAAMVMTYLNGMDLKDTHRIASELAAYVCTQKGATPVIPAEILREICS
ncbi:MAG: carbohydrate kinase [Bacteroidetes bacterium]|nr:carbohydrate kinase [Bacteroidota bacterium]